MISAKPFWASFPKTFSHGPEVRNWILHLLNPITMLQRKRQREAGREEERQGAEGRKAREKSEVEREMGR